MNKLLILFFIFLFSSCMESSVIPVSETLELGLNNNYYDYVRLINASCKGDTNALEQFLKIDYIFEAPSYEHGDIILDLLEYVGDSNFVLAINKLSDREKKILCGYILGAEVGDFTGILKKKYFNHKVVFNLVGISEEML
jgi:hypothetical protein